MAFLLRKRKLTDMMLMGNTLPWVSSIKHLGVRVEDKIDGYYYYYYWARWGQT